MISSTRNIIRCEMNTIVRNIPPKNKLRYNFGSKKKQY